MRPFFQIAMVIHILGCLWLDAATAVEIELRPQCDCRGFVTLGDVAEIRDADKRRESQLADVPLVPGPAAGQVRWLRVREIQEILQLRGIELQDLEFRGASRVEVTRQVAAAPSRDSRSSPTAYGNADWQQFSVVAIRPLARGAILNDLDVELRELSVPRRSGTGDVDNVEEVVGYQLNRPVAAGQPLDMSMLRRPQMVQRGGTVTVVARAGGFQVSTRGRALQDGALDDIVSVELLDDRNKKLMGRVVGLEELEVFAEGTRIEPAAARNTASTPKPQATP